MDSLNKYLIKTSAKFATIYGVLAAATTFTPMLLFILEGKSNITIHLWQIIAPIVVWIISFVCVYFKFHRIVNRQVPDDEVEEDIEEEISE